MKYKKIKILQLCAIDETVKSLLLPLVDRLTADGFDVVACCSEGKTSNELRQKGYNIENIEIARSMSPVSNIKTIINLYKYLKKEKFDIVHVHTPVAALLGRIAAKLAKTPLIIYTAHGFYFHERMSRLVFKVFTGIEKFAGRMLTDYIFTQSEEDRITAVNKKFIKKDRICTIGNGVDVYNKFNASLIKNDVIERKRRELGIAENEKVIMFVGRLVREKGIIDLLQAFNMIEYNEYKLLLVGDCFTGERDTATYEYVNKAIEGSPNIIAAGRRHDINELLYLCDVFILPSYREGMPRSIIEAMAMGKPVIATNIRGCREEVVDGETGFLVPVNDPAALRDAMIKILENQQLAEKMGRNARARAEMLFDEEKVLNKQVEIISRLVRE